MHEDCLHVVISGVARRYPGGPHGHGRFRQKAVAYLAGCFFWRETVFFLVFFYVAGLDRGRNLQAAGQFLDIEGIRLGILAAQLMVQVGYVQFDAEFSLQLYQQVQQADRVRPAGYPDEDFLPRCYEAVLSDKSQDALFRG